MSQANHFLRLRAETHIHGENMTEQIQSALISRRTVFSFIGVALPATIFAVSQGAAQTPGMERREERREERQERREDRRDDREERREDRRDERSGVVNPPATGGTAPPSTETYHGGPKSDD
jgi:hypothetical protein